MPIIRSGVRAAAVQSACAPGDRRYPDRIAADSDLVPAFRSAGKRRQRPHRIDDALPDPWRADATHPGRRTISSVARLMGNIHDLCGFRRGARFRGARRQDCRGKRRRLPEGVSATTTALTRRVHSRSATSAAARISGIAIKASRGRIAHIRQHHVASAVCLRTRARFSPAP